MEHKIAPVDVIDLVAMRNEGWQVAEIAAHFGVDRSTIYRYMEEWGIPVHPNNLGPRTHCLRQHELTDENTIVYKDGRRECRVCKRKRDAAYQRRKYWAEKSKVQA